MNCGGMSEQRLTAEIKSRLEHTIYSLKMLQEDTIQNRQNHEIRKEFDSQTASLMAFFKFQIDTSSMTASLYAHLVARFQREIKALRTTK